MLVAAILLLRNHKEYHSESSAAKQNNSGPRRLIVIVSTIIVFIIIRLTIAGAVVLMRPSMSNPETRPDSVTYFPGYGREFPFFNESLAVAFYVIVYSLCDFFPAVCILAVLFFAISGPMRRKNDITMERDDKSDPLLDIPEQYRE